MNKPKIIGFAFVLALGLAGGFALSEWTGHGGGKSDAPASDTKKILYWQAPMDPNFRRDQPGKSPMGMDLIPVYGEEEAGAGDKNYVRINPVVENNIGVRIARVVRATLYRNIDTVGFVRADDDKTAIVDVRSEGWIEKLYVKSPGEVVRRGQPLFDLYSRPLVSAQEEYLQAVRIGKASLIRASKSRLQALGMSVAQIASVRKSAKAQRLIRMYAPQDGVITMLGAGEGAFVKPGRQIMMLADLSRVWVLAEVFESQAGWVKAGQNVDMRIDASPGRVWKGVVDYVYPTLIASSRTVQVRLRFDNPDGALKPDMYAKVNIKAEPHVGVLAIDREALIRTGKADRVILALGDGRFRPAHVVAGMESGDKVEILEGLAEGETVVISSQFLIDSEASLRGTSLRMYAPVTDFASEAETTGVVESMMADHGMIAIRHEPVEAFGWPAMNMNFVINPGFLQNLEAGDAVRFTIRGKANKNGDFVITAIRKVAKKKGPVQ